MEEKDRVQMRIIFNTDKRLDILQRLLSFMVNQKLCWTLNNQYIIKTNLMLNQISSKEEHLFQAIQNDSLRKGFYYNCFNLNTDEKNNREGEDKSGT